MDKKMTRFILSLSILPLVRPAGPVWADDSTTNAVEHPINAYHEHEVKESATDAQVFSQQKAEAKARMDQAKADYEKSLQANGAENDVTKQAKTRLDSARKEYRKYAKKSS